MQHLAPLLPAYRARCPEVRVDLALADQMVDLVDEGFDLARSESPAGWATRWSRAG